MPARRAGGVSFKVQGCELPNVAAEVAAAQTDVRRFVVESGWDESFAARTFDSVEVFGDQEDLWERILELNQLPSNTPLPTAGLVAALEKRVLVAVCPAEYLRLNPEYAAGEFSWRRLLAHEIFHRVHVNLLDGNEDAMGPPWFYEGLAVLAAGQHLDTGLVYHNAAEALAGAQTKAPLAYRRFLAAVRYFTRCASVPELVAHAGGVGFDAWLKETCTRARR
ncbi:MAG: hypothetical protein HY903_23490 [Deltaproteobacteria bacterium]|nr:hypothetical protein [Deltaproteobacteria bacterium]